MSEEKLTKEDIIKSINGRFYYLDDYTCFLYKELERTNNIIKEVREFIKGMPNNEYIGYWKKEIFEILDQVEENK